MNKIYIPLEEGESYACYTIYDKDTVRAYVSTPAINSTSNYTDYYVNSHYMYKRGIQSWGNYNTNLPTCLGSTEITTDYFYRNDISDILIIFMIISIVGVYIPVKLFSKLFGRWVRL